MSELDLGWLEETLEPQMVQDASQASSTRLVREAFGYTSESVDASHLWVMQTLDALAWDELVNDPKSDRSRALARQAFQLARGLIEPAANSTGARLIVLKAACLAWIGDETSLAGRLLAELEAPATSNEAGTWGDEVETAVLDAWILLLRKRDWHDLNEVTALSEKIRIAKKARERAYVFPEGPESGSRAEQRARAWHMVWGYQLLDASKAAHEYLTTGQMTGWTDAYDPMPILDSIFAKASAAASAAGSMEQEEIARLLNFACQRMIGNSTWSIARAANPLTQRFVTNLVSQSRTRPVLELLPPQRQALAEAGLIRGGKRSVVVSMPTSAGKTLIAQFRILEAINAFREQQPWVAYVAPSRALVNQVTRRLRRDFSSLGIKVEQLSPALEVDGVEHAILADTNPETQFQVLVATPEKLDLLLRSDWARQLERPMTLLIVDEAHMIASQGRGIRLELLLATANREVRDAQFLLLTPFIDNATDIASWLDPVSHEGVKLELDWSPNDRLIALSSRQKGKKKGDFSLSLKTIHTSRQTLHSQVKLPEGKNRPMGLTWSAANSPTKIAAATAKHLEGRGATITVVQRPDHTWNVANQLAQDATAKISASGDLEAVQTLVVDEYGDNHPLADYLSKGIGVHHAGLSPEMRSLMEWLTETGDISHLVATTTIAAGVNFPVANVVLGSHQYPYGIDMDPADFWNLVGRAGRVDQGQVGVVALAANDETREQKLRTFVDRNVTDLTSSLVGMVEEALNVADRLDLHILSHAPEWSSFVQFLAHSYRQMGRPDVFAQEVEPLLRGTLGFKELRNRSEQNASELIRAVRAYGLRLQGAPLALVDATGFSLESVRGSLARLAAASIDQSVWSADLFGSDRRVLGDLLGVMLEVPELHDNLIEGASNARVPGTFIARVVSDWVNGVPLREIAEKHYSRPNETELSTLTRAAQRIYRNIAPTVAWGLSAMQSMTVQGEENLSEIRNLPAYAFYGVNNERDISLRLAGVPRPAVAGLRTQVNQFTEEINPQATRLVLRNLDAGAWDAALGVRGQAYRRAWEIIDGSI